MKKIFILVVLFASALTAWNAKECSHIFVEEEQAEIKVSRSFLFTYSTNIDTIVYGKHEGIDLVCVKCFHKQKQVVDYGDRQQIGFQTPAILDTTEIIFGGSILDTGHILRWATPVPQPGRQTLELNLPWKQIPGIDSIVPGQNILGPTRKAPVIILQDPILNGQPSPFKANDEKVYRLYPDSVVPHKKEVDYFDNYEPAIYKFKFSDSTRPQRKTSINTDTCFCNEINQSLPFIANNGDTVSWYRTQLLCGWCIEKSRK